MIDEIEAIAAELTAHADSTIAEVTTSDVSMASRLRSWARRLRALSAPSGAGGRRAATQGPDAEKAMQAVAEVIGRYGGHDDDCGYRPCLNVCDCGFHKAGRHALQAVSDALAAPADASQEQEFPVYRGVVGPGGQVVLRAEPTARPSCADTDDPTPYRCFEQEFTDMPPRRICVDKMTRAELAIRVAVQVVEEMGADVRLTDAVALLQAARESVADVVDGVAPVTRKFWYPKDDAPVAPKDAEKNLEREASYSRKTRPS